MDFTENSNSGLPATNLSWYWASDFKNSKSKNGAIIVNENNENTVETRLNIMLSTESNQYGLI